MERFDGGDVLPKRVNRNEGLLLQKQHSRPGVIQNVSEFLRRKPHIQWKQYGASFQNPIIGFEKPVTIQAQKSNPIAALYACASQSASETNGTLSQLRVGEPLISTHDRSLVWELLLRIAQEPNGCKG